MTALVSAGIVAWRLRDDRAQFLLVHPGGPFWSKKDAHAWSIPKGLVDEGEEPFAAALREFAEEVGQPIDGERAIALEPCRMSGGKRVLSWLVKADLDVTTVHSNLFEMEWPPKSGQRAQFPEVDRAEWFERATALEKIHEGLAPILHDAIAHIARSTSSR